MHVIGTAGHVDHGKSTLIERITGIDPDRLAEEKRRGLTIDLGFAWITLPSGREAGIVDVPGHERFVHNMLAGAGSIDATIFVVAANEGWKPQSEEHLAILDLLGAHGGVVALTKRDLVSDEELEAVTREVQRRLSGTVLDGASVVPVSATSGDGVDLLMREIDAMLERTPEASDHDRPRLFADRSFSMKGAGTVITGTLTGGRLRVDDEVEVLPIGTRARVRSIQTHKQKRDEATPGSRVALNIAGLDRHEVRRGDAIVRPHQWRATDVVDVTLKPVRRLDHPLSGRGAFKLYLGAAEVDAKLRFIEPGSLEPRGVAFARLLLAETVVADAFDRFVLRSTARDETVAGGVVLDPHPVQRKLARAHLAERAAELQARRDAGPGGLVGSILAERGVVPAADMIWLSGRPASNGPLRGFAVSDGWLRDTTRKLIDALKRHHATSALSKGMPREDAMTATGIDDARLFGELASATDGVVLDGPIVRLEAHTITLSPAQQQTRDAIVAALDEAGMQPPSLTDLANTHGAALVKALIDTGELVRFSNDFALSKDRYNEAKKVLADTIATEGPITASRAKDALKTSRKYVIPLLEHFDASGFTARDGDVRKLR